MPCTDRDRFHRAVYMDDPTQAYHGFAQGRDQAWIAYLGDAGQPETLACLRGHALRRQLVRFAPGKCLVAPGLARHLHPTAPVFGTASTACLDVRHSVF